MTTRGVDVDEAPQTLGEMTSRAIDKQARQLHLDGRHFEKSLLQVRSLIRMSNPLLAELERSSESYKLASRRIIKTADRDLVSALKFVETWS